MGLRSFHSPKGQDIAIPAHILPNLPTHTQTGLFAPQQYLSSAYRTRTQEHCLLSMNPHQIPVEVRLEVAPVPAMPGKVHVIPTTSIVALLYMPDLTLAEHLSAPVPSVCEVCHEGRGLGAVVDTSSILTSQGGRCHLDAAAVGTVAEAGGLGGAVELVGHAQVFGLLFKEL